jgi:hypothetical protein
MLRQEEGLVSARKVRLAEVFPVALTEGALFSVNRLAEQVLSLLTLRNTILRNKDIVQCVGYIVSLAIATSQVLEMKM